MVRDVLDTHHASRPRICVRISAVTTEDFAGDLAAAVHPNLTAIVLPQVVSADDIVATDAALGRAEAAAGVRVGSTIIFPMLETANALRTAYDIASSSPRIAYMGGATSRGGDLALGSEPPAPALEVPVQRLGAGGNGLVAGAGMKLGGHRPQAEPRGVQPPGLG